MTMATNFRDLARERFPWLTPALLDIFAAEWSATGDPQAALDKVRNTGEYGRVFPGIRRDDGSLRMSEGEYYSQRAGFREALAEFGFDPSAYESQFAGLFENEVDAGEFARAAQEAALRFVEPGGDRTPLAEQFLSRFIDTGSATLALEDVRQSSEYGDVFAGNVREDGTLRMDEQEYFAYKRGWRRTLAGFGLDPREFEARGRFAEAVSNEVSVQELGQRLQTVQDSIIDNVESVQRFYAQNYGLDLTSEAILGMAVDPEVQRDVLERRVSAAQIGGEASLQGFARSIERAEELARAGVSQQQARDLYGKAGRSLAGLSAASRRFNRGGTSLDDFEEAFALGDARQTTRLDRVLRSEEASFGSRADARRSSDGFGLSGLRER